MPNFAPHLGTEVQGTGCRRFTSTRRCKMNANNPATPLPPKFPSPCPLLLVIVNTSSTTDVPPSFPSLAVSPFTQGAQPQQCNKQNPRLWLFARLRKRAPMRVTLQRESMTERPARERDVHVLGQLLRGTAMKDTLTPWNEVAGLVPSTCLSMKMGPLYI